MIGCMIARDSVLYCDRPFAVSLLLPGDLKNLNCRRHQLVFWCSHYLTFSFSFALICNIISFQQIYFLLANFSPELCPLCDHTTAAFLMLSLMLSFTPRLASFPVKLPLSFSSSQHLCIYCDIIKTKIYTNFFVYSTSK